MKFCVLGSGSKGNATYIETRETAILIDAGFSARMLKERLAAAGIDWARLDAVLVTHEHGDHVRGIAVLSRQASLPVYANPATLQSGSSHLDGLHACREFGTGESFVLRDLHIHPFAVSHDAADPVGFVVTDGRAALGYCTDTGQVSRLMQHRLSGINGLILECNHDPVMLQNSAYPPYLKQRVRGNKGHLANADAARFLQRILHQGLEHVVLAHLSEANNLPELALQAVKDEFGGNGPVPHGSGIPAISVASQHCPGAMIRLGGDPAGGAAW